MTRSKRSKKGICVYCGGTARLGRDHVPPRALFGGRFPPNLITVPSCDRCNNGASKDDELFRLAYSTRRDAPSVAERDLAFAATLRSFNKPEASSFARRIRSQTRVVERTSPAGLYLGRGFVYEAQGAPLDRVIRRITKGLFFHEKGRRLPDDCVVKPIALCRLKDLRPRRDEWFMEMIEMLLGTVPTRFGTAFGYWRLWSEFGWARSFWLFEIYGRLEFICGTHPKPTGDVLGHPPPSDECGRACVPMMPKIPMLDFAGNKQLLNRLYRAINGPRKVEADAAFGR